MSKASALVGIFSLMLVALSAQPYTPVRLAEPAFGLDGSSVMQELNLFGGELYANLHAIYDDEGAGLLSRIDPVNGVAMGIRFPENTPAVSSSIERTDGNKTFASRRDFRKGSSLYLIEEGQNIAKQLLQRDEREFRGFTDLNGFTYFVADNISEYGDSGVGPPCFNNFIFYSSELWRTDGTPEGTMLIHTFPPSLQNTIHLYAGNSRLLIVGHQVVIDSYIGLLFLYDPIEERLLTFPNGSDARSVPYVPPNYVRYAGGYFYLGSPEDIFSPVNGAQVMVLSEDQMTLAGVQLPAITVRGTTLNRYQDVELALLKDSVYLVAHRKVLPVGYDLFHIRPGNTLTLTPIGEPTVSRAPGGKHISSVVSNDTLYFLSPISSTFAYLWAFHPDDAEPHKLADVRVPGEYVYCEKGGSNLYIASRQTDDLLKYNLNSGEIKRINVNLYSPSRFNFPNPLNVTQAGAYYLSANHGLRLWAADSRDDTAFGNFYTNSTNLVPQLWHTVDAGANWLLNTNRLNLVSTADGGMLPVEDGGAWEDNELRSLTHNNNHSIFTTHPRVGGGLSEDYVFRLENNQLVATPVFFNEELISSPYNIGLVQQNYDGRAAVSFRKQFGSSIFSMAEPGPAGGLRINSILSQEYDFPRRNFDTTFFAIKQVEEEWIASLFDYDGNILRTTTIEDLCSVTAVTEQRMFAVCPDFTEDVQEFHLLATADEEEIVLSRDGTLLIPYNSFAFFAINERIVFIADHEEYGVEWFVANDTTGDVRLLQDIAPGPDFGTTFDGPVYHDGNEGVYFLANDGVHGTELWFTDGSSDGTILVQDINPGLGSSNPGSFVAHGRELYFSARGPSGRELYRMNLEDRNVELFIDLAPGAASSWPYGFKVADGKFYFFGRAAAGQQYDLYTLDLSVSTTSSSLTDLPARVYPNPAGENPTTVDAPSGESLTAIEIFNAAGQRLRDLKASGNQTTISLTDLPAGTYWLHAHYASGRHTINPIIR